MYQDTISCRSLSTRPSGTIILTSARNARQGPSGWEEGRLSRAQGVVRLSCLTKKPGTCIVVNCAIVTFCFPYHFLSVLPKENIMSPCFFGVSPGPFDLFPVFISCKNLPMFTLSGLVARSCVWLRAFFPVSSQSLPLKSRQSIVLFCDVETLNP